MMLTHPVSNWQRYLLDAHASPLCTESFAKLWLVSQSLHIAPNADPRRLKRAFDRLVQRHDTLRISFVEERGGWRARISERHSTGLVELVFGDVSDAQFEKIVDETATASLPILSDPLFNMQLLRFGKRGDVLVTRMHHALADGFGIVLLSDEFLKLLLNLPCENNPVSHGEYLANYDNPGFGQQEVVEAFWEKELRPVPPVINIGRNAKGLEPFRWSLGAKTFSSQEFEISNRDIARLREMAAAGNTTPFAFCVAALAATVREVSGTQQFYLSIPVAWHSQQLNGYVGDHTLDLLLRYSHVKGQPLAASANNLTGRINGLIQRLPASAARRWGAWDRRIIEAGGYPRQIECSIDVPEGRINRSPFKRAHLSAPGTPHRLGPLTITLLKKRSVVGAVDELSFRLRASEKAAKAAFYYDDQAYTGEEIKALAHKVFAQLAFAET